MILIFVVVIVIAVTLYFTLTIRTKDLPPPDPVSPTQYLEDRKAQIYENLRDLQFEYRVGKLSDADYQQTKLGLQKELADVLGEIEKFGARPVKAPTAPTVEVPERPPANVCPHCNAQFPKPMKFCGECGKAMAQ
ncbi:MAG TPA: hypothetical protein VK752_10555 [Bryobacteraceae bacterium]|jgi:hypothetical protein|nr:hypothetical protein [Bryobacteraceae bacterium]